MVKALDYKILQRIAEEQGWFGSFDHRDRRVRYKPYPHIEEGVIAESIE